MGVPQDCYKGFNSTFKESIVEVNFAFSGGSSLENRERPLVALFITHSPPNADVVSLTRNELREIISCVLRASLSVTSILYRFTYLVVTCLVIVCLVLVCHIDNSP